MIARCLAIFTRLLIAEDALSGIRICRRQGASRPCASRCA